MKCLALSLSLCVAVAKAQTPVQIPDKLAMADMELVIREGAKGPLTSYVSKLTSNNKYFRQMVDRADAYLPIVERIFQEEGLPEDFKYLVIQESSLVSNQVSSSNAVGYWQFKKETATEMGLRVDEQIDERMNIVSSSRSAARYLMRHNNYMQNWTYSLLAYYAGLGGAKNLIDPTKIGSKTLDIDENTHWYILKFIAHKIAFEPHLYRNAAGPSLRVQEYGECENKSIDQLASETNYPVDQIQFYNRWILNGYVPGDKDYTLILPLKGEDSALESPVFAKASPPVEKLEPWREKMFFGLIEKPVSQPEPVVLANGQTEIPVFFAWNGIKAIQAKKGDNSSKLALLAGISRDEFLEYNDLRIFDPIVPGEVYYVDNKKHKSKVPFHTAQYGESLWEVAQKYGITLKSLMAKNRMPRPEKLRPGRVLWLRHTRPSDEPIKFEPVPEPQKLDFIVKKPVLVNPAQNGNSPVVKPVDLKMVEATAKAVLGSDTLKPESSENQVENGQDIEIEIASAEPAAQPEPAKTPVALASGTESTVVQKVVAENQPAHSQPSRTEVVYPEPVEGKILVSPGMTWYQISRRYKTSIDSLLSWNQGLSRELKVGSRITVLTNRLNPIGKVEKVTLAPANPSVSIPTARPETARADADFYEVKAGDSAYSIARKYGMKVERLLEINQREDASLRIGEKLKVEIRK